MSNDKLVKKAKQEARRFARKSMSEMEVAVKAKFKKDTLKPKPKFIPRFLWESLRSIFINPLT